MWGSLAWRYPTVVPCLYSGIPVAGYEMSPLPGQLDKLQHIMLDSHPPCSGYLLQLSIKCNIIKFWKYIFLYLVSYSLWCGDITTPGSSMRCSYSLRCRDMITSSVIPTHLIVFEQQMSTTLILTNCDMLAKWTKIFLSIARR